MVNYSTEEFRRVDWTFGIGYGDDTSKARAIIMNCIKNESRISNVPAEPFVEVSGLGDSSVNFAVRVWARQEDYWGIFFRMNETIYNEFNANGINIPFPQMDVHIHNQEK
jgi:small conductance mechanosensitive channel